MFTKKELRALLIPLVAEQILTGIMGAADTLMVSSVGEAAISGVSPPAGAAPERERR